MDSDRERAEALFAEWAREGVPPFDNVGWMNPEDREPIIAGIERVAALARAAGEAAGREQAERELEAITRLCYREVNASEGHYYHIVLETFDKQEKDHDTEAEAIAAVRAAAGLAPTAGDGAEGGEG